MSQESLLFDGHLRVAGGLVSAWSWKPLVVYDPNGAVSSLVSHQLVQHAQASLILWNRARFDLDLPIFLSQGGTPTVIEGQTHGAPSGGGLGDFRLGGDVRLFRHARSGVRGAVGAQLFLPTGDTGSYTSDGGVRFWPRLMAAGDHRRAISWAGSLGVHVRPEHGCGCDLSPGTELTLGLAGSWRFSPRWRAGPELYASKAITGPFASRASLPVELLLAGHFAIRPSWNLSFGLAPGLTRGAGAPAFRGVIGLQYVFGVAAPKSELPAAPPAWNTDVSTPAPNVSTPAPTEVSP
jgi:hypothetical protein